MFEVGFWELVMVGVVALLVVGPERLPGLARTAGLWIGKARYFLSSVKAEINREIKADELKRLVDQQSQIPELHEFIDETRRNFNETHHSFNNYSSNSTLTTHEPNAALAPQIDTPAANQSEHSQDVPSIRDP